MKIKFAALAAALVLLLPSVAAAQDFVLVMLCGLQIKAEIYSPMPSRCVFCASR